MFHINVKMKIMRMNLKLMSKHTITWMSVFGFLVLPYLVQTKDISKQIEFKAEDDGSKTLEFFNIALEQKRNGYIFVGARNRLYQLDFDLMKVHDSVVTGPVKNNLVCECKTSGLFDNINKLLLIDYPNNRIIACGSVEQGICELRELRNINSVLRGINTSTIHSQPHVAASGSLSTVGFLATIGSNREYLYVGSSKTYHDEPVLAEKSQSSFYTIAKRAIPKDSMSDEMFSNEILNYGLKEHQGIKMQEAFAKNNYRLNFISGFAIDETGYFVLTHPLIHHYSSNFEATYISQLCLDDGKSKESRVDIQSYLELPLACSTNGASDLYTKAVASTTAKVGSLLENQLNSRENHGRSFLDVIFIAFERSDGQPGSAVCMFTLPEIEQRFVKLASDCMKTSASSSPNYIPWVDVSKRECKRGVSYLKS